MKTIQVLALLFGVLLLPAQAFAQFGDGVQEVNPEGVAAMLAEGALFVDVRETNEVEVLAYDLPGVMSLPLSELPDRLAELSSEQPIILACRSGKRSLKAAQLLSENNFDQLFSLAGGIIAWEAAELPVKHATRDTEMMGKGKKQCCAGGKSGNSTEKACCSKKAEGKSAKASCGGGKGKGKSCCAGGAR